jgi:hypothetical protein
MAYSKSTPDVSGTQRAAFDKLKQDGKYRGRIMFKSHESIARLSLTVGQKGGLVKSKLMFERGEVMGNLKVNATSVLFSPNAFEFTQR